MAKQADGRLRLQLDFCLFGWFCTGTVGWPWTEL